MRALSFVVCLVLPAWFFAQDDGINRDSIPFGVDELYQNNMHGQEIESITTEEPFHLALSGRHYGDSIVLRWVPAKQVLWKRWSRCGYNIDRKLIKTDNEFPETSIERINNTPIKPLPLAEWEPLIAYDSTYVPIAAECLYGQMVNQFNSEMSLTDIGRVAEEANLRFGLAMFSADLGPIAANALGLRWVDTDIKKGASYLYRIMPHETCEEISALDTAYFYIEYASGFEPMASPILEGDEFQDFVTLKWDILHTPIPYTAYWLEVKRPGSGEFELVQKEPFVYSQAQTLHLNEKAYLHFRDSLPNLYEPHEYRLFGVDLFGDRSLYSDTVRVQTKDLTPPIPPRFTNIESYDNKFILLNWVNDHKREPDLRGYILEKSLNIEGPYVLVSDTLIDPVVVSYLDTSYNVILPHFYRIGAVDTAGNVAFSAPGYGFLNDTIPPHKPIGLEGFIDSLGKVHLRWLQNEDIDLQGYRVFISNSMDYEFDNITGFVIPDTTHSFDITLNTTTKHLYVYVVAVDLRFFHSEPSDTIQLTRPDTIPPSMPIIHDLSAVENGVLISFIGSSSDDVKYHKVWRKLRQSDQDFILYDSIIADGRELIVLLDSNVVSSYTYSYTISAVDYFGNESPRCHPFKISWYENKVIPPPHITQLVVNKESNRIEINYELIQHPEQVSHVIILRNINSVDLKTHSSVSPSQNMIIDQDILRKGVYHYAIQAIYQNGQRSLISDLKKINID